MGKNETALLGSGQWYFVNVREWEEMKKYILDDAQYKIVFDGLNADSKYINIHDVYHFWSKIDSFGKIPFEKWVLEQIVKLSEEEKEFIENRIRAWHNIYTLEKLRSEISFFNSRNS